MFNDIRALKEPHLPIVAKAYGQFFRKVRALFKAPGYDWLDRRMSTARTHMLLEQVYWSVTWLPRHDLDDYGRVRDRMFDILAQGVAPAGARWAPARLPDPPADAQDGQRETFLMAATKLINQRGYRGASVEKISEQLNVTQGLVLSPQCGEGRPRGRMLRAQLRRDAARAIGRAGGKRAIIGTRSRPRRRRWWNSSSRSAGRCCAPRR